jgi:hypothetical protein
MDARRVAVAEEDVGAGAAEQHVGEVLPAHQRGDRGVDLAGARDLFRDRTMIGLLFDGSGDGIAALYSTTPFAP